MSTGGNNLNFLEAHASGLAALLKYRKIPDMYSSNEEWRLFQTVNGQLVCATFVLNYPSNSRHHQQLGMCLQRGIPSFIAYRDLKEVYESSKFAMLRLTGMVHRGVDLLALWKDALATPDTTDPAEFKTLLEQLDMLGQIIDAWDPALGLRTQMAHHQTPAASTQPRWLRRVLDHPGVPRVSHQYAVVQVIYVWNLARIVRIKIATALLNASFEHPEYNISASHQLDVIADNVENACASIFPIFTMPIDTKPYAETSNDVCGFRAHMAIQPLVAARNALPLLPQTGTVVARAAWVNEVLNFMMEEFLAPLKAIS